MTARADHAGADGAMLAALRDVALSREPDRYFAATLAPATVRYDLIVLAAFAAEIARIPSMVREPLAGEIRLQWWRDALAPDGAASAAGQPVATAMRVTIDKYRLPGELVGSVIDAEADALHGERPVSEAALRTRMAAGEGALFQLAARICTGGAPGSAADDRQLAELAGVAYGLSRALAQFPAGDEAWLAIPRALLADEALPSDDPATALDDPHAISAVRDLGGQAREAYADAVARLRTMSRRDRMAFLPLAMVKPNLAALERTLSQRRARPVDPPRIGRLLRIGWAHASGRL